MRPLQIGLANILIFFVTNFGFNFAQLFDCSRYNNNITNIDSWLSQRFLYFEKPGDIRRINVYDDHMETTVVIASENVTVAKNREKHIQLSVNSSDTVDIFTEKGTMNFNSISHERMTINVEGGIFALQTDAGQFAIDVNDASGYIPVGDNTTMVAFKVVSANSTYFLKYGGKEIEIRDDAPFFNGSLAQIYLRKHRGEWRLTVRHKRDGQNFLVTMTPRFAEAHSVRGIVKMTRTPFLDHTPKTRMADWRKVKGQELTTMKMESNGGTTVYEHAKPPYCFLQEYDRKNFTEKVQICPWRELSICVANSHGVAHFSGGSDARVVANGGALTATRRGEIHVRGGKTRSLDISSRQKVVSIVGSADNLRCDLNDRSLNATIGSDKFAVNEDGVSRVDCANSTQTESQSPEVGGVVSVKSCAGGAASVAVGKPYGLGWRLTSAARSANLSADGKAFSANWHFASVTLNETTVEVRFQNGSRDSVKIADNFFHVKSSAVTVTAENNVVKVTSYACRITVTTPKTIVTESSNKYNSSALKASQPEYGSTSPKYSSANLPKKLTYPRAPGIRVMLETPKSKPSTVPMSATGGNALLPLVGGGSSKNRAHPSAPGIIYASEHNDSATVPVSATVGNALLPPVAAGSSENRAYPSAPGIVYASEHNDSATVETPKRKTTSVVPASIAAANVLLSMVAYSNANFTKKPIYPKAPGIRNMTETPKKNTVGSTVTPSTTVSESNHGLVKTFHPRFNDYVRSTVSSYAIRSTTQRNLTGSDYGSATDVPHDSYSNSSSDSRQEDTVIVIRLTQNSATNFEKMAKLTTVLLFALHSTLLLKTTVFV